MDKSSYPLDYELLQLLREVRAAIPLEPNCHHGISLLQYGSDESGFEDRLAFVMRLKGDAATRILFIEPGDLDKPYHQLVEDIKSAIQDGNRTALIEDK